MMMTNSRRARPWCAGVLLAGAALLASACSSSTSAPAGADSTLASSPAAVGSSAVVSSPAPAESPSTPVSVAATPSVTSTGTGTPTGPSTFLATGQDINSTALYEPSCSSGCPLSGDSTAILSAMKWSAWSATEAVGTGIYKLDDCNPNCAAGQVSDVPAVVTFSAPVKVCAKTGTRWFWSKASFTFPKGLPSSLQGAAAPQNPWVFSTVITAAQQSCRA